MASMDYKILFTDPGKASLVEFEREECLMRIPLKVSFF